MSRTPGTLVPPAALLGLLVLALAACATPTTEVVRPPPTDAEALYTASGRYPAARGGILIAQNAALSEGRALCEQQGRRFRPLGSLAGEDASTGEAVYAVRFRCAARPGSPPIVAPSPLRGPSVDGRM